MDRTYKYTILTAIPNFRRGERVNIGVAVFLEDRIDIRFKQASYKIRALTGENWDGRIESVDGKLRDLFNEGGEPECIAENFAMIEPNIRLSAMGWLSASSSEEYEERVTDIIKTLVALPKRERQETKSRVNTEIARSLNKLNILANGSDSFESKKVVRNLSIDSKEGLTADFALKNGKFHVASTLELRKNSASLAEAALKSIVLDKAEKKFGTENTRKIGIFAVDTDMRDTFNAHIKLLGDYSDEMYDWLDLQSRRRFERSLCDAVGLDPDMLI